MNEAERAEPAADESADQSSDEEQKPDDIETELVLGIADHRLQGPDGASAFGARARVAVHARDTEFFPFSAVDFPRPKSLKKGIGKEKPRGLEEMSPAFLAL